MNPRMSPDSNPMVLHVTTVPGTLRFLAGHVAHAKRKGFDVHVVLYGPGVLMASATRGWPSVGNEGFPGNLAINNQIKTLIKEGAHVYACRFAMGALYGFREDDLIDGVKAFNPLDVLDSALTAWRAGAFQLNTWTV